MSLADKAASKLRLIESGASSIFVEVPIPADFMTSDYPPPSLVIAPGVPIGEVTGWSGNGGAGKMHAIKIIAAHFVCGRPWNGFTMLGNNRRVAFVGRAGGPCRASAQEHGVTYLA